MLALPLTTIESRGIPPCSNDFGRAAGAAMDVLSLFSVSYEVFSEGGQGDPDGLGAAGPFIPRLCDVFGNGSTVQGLPQVCPCNAAAF